MESVLITGFPGFLASAFVPRVLARTHRDLRIDCLVQPHFLPEARRRVAAMNDDARRRVSLSPGDITRNNLGLSAEALHVQRDCTEIYHFAAIYDLGVSRQAAYAVNVEGTRNLLRFAEHAGRLTHLHHLSTCYVSGNYRGKFRETDLDRGQSFNNHYEETKFLSEKLVQENFSKRYNTTIYRPSIVTGDSATGAAPKMDGLYYVIQWLLAQPRVVAIMPRIGDPDEHRFNVVPSDFVIAALSYLSDRRPASSTVYHLCDPNPRTIRELRNMLAKLTDRRVFDLSLSPSLARILLGTVCAIHPWLDIPKEATDYLAHPGQYDNTNTVRDLAGSGIEVPDIADYLPRLVDFVRSAR